MDTIVEFILFCLGLFCLGILVMVFIAISEDFSKTMNNGIGWVNQDRNMSAIQELIKEENGCVYYVDVRGKEGKTCGSYQIELIK